jgi:hypothetical protein
MDRSLPALILVPSGAYGSLGYVLQDLGHAFQKLGRPVIEVDASRSDWTEQLLKAIGQGVAFGVGISGIGVDLEVRLIDGGKARLWSQVTTPFFSWHCDHPTYFSPRHTLSDRWVVHGYVFPDHARFQSEYGRSRSMVSVVHLGYPDLTRYGPAPSGNSPDRIFFAKSGGDPNAIERHWKAKFPHTICTLLHNAVDALDELGSSAHAQAIARAGQAIGLHIDPASRLGYILIAQIDDYIRQRNATLIAQRLLNRPVDIYGAGWDHLKDQAKRAKFHGPIDFKEMIQRLRTSRVAVSMNPCVNDAAHDRLHFALAAGAIPVSDRNDFIEHHFPSLAPYCFRFTPDSIDAALDHAWADRNQSAQRIAEAAEVSRANFSFDVAAQRIEAACEALRFTNEPSNLPIHVVLPETDW